MPIYTLTMPIYLSVNGKHYTDYTNDTLTHFTQILMAIEPGRMAPRGTVPSLPIPFNNISSFTFITFVSLLYQPNNFHTHTQGWRNIKKLADKGGFPHIWL